MAKFSVIKTGGNQYLVKENDEIIVDQLDSKEGSEIEVETLAVFDSDSAKIELGTPGTATKTKIKVVANLKGDKIRIGRFRAKSRYRKVMGFRPRVSKIKVISV